MKTVIYQAIHHETALGAVTELLRRADTRELSVNHIVIVPERYTLSVERHIFSSLESKGAFNISVATLSRLWLITGGGGQYLTEFGAVMLMRRAAEMSDLLYFSPQTAFHGFYKLLYDTVSRLIGMNITPQQLMLMCRDKNDAMSLKLGDIARVYENFLTLSQGKYVDRGGLSWLLAQRALTHPLFFSSYFYVAGFESFSEAELECFKNISSVCRGMTFALGCDTGELNIQALQRVFCGKCTVLRLDDGMSEFSRYIWDTTRTTAATAFEGKQEHNFQLYIAADALDECELLAQNIVNDIAGGLRLKDIAVLMPDAKAYSYPLQKTFEKYRIPYYIQDGGTLAGHPLYTALFSLLRTTITNCAAEDVLLIVKSARMLPQEASGADTWRHKTDIFENYCLKFGIDRTRFLQPFTLGDNEHDGLDIAEYVRQSFYHIYEDVIAAEKSGKIAEYVLNFVSGIGFLRGTESLSSHLLKSGLSKQAQAAAQVPGKIDGLVRQLLEVYPGAQSDTETFLQLLNTGALSVKLSTVPVAADILICGDLDSARYSPVSKIYILGANEGDFPSRPQENALITRELALNFKQLEEFASGDYRLLRHEHNKIRTLLSREADFVISCRSGEGSLGTLMPSEYMALLGTVLKKGIMPAQPLLPWGAPYISVPEKTRLKSAPQLFYRSGSTSVSSVETYFYCPRRHFYRYGLFLQPRDVAELLSIDRGSFLHGVIELFVRDYHREADAANIAENCFTRMLSDPRFARHQSGTKAQGVFMRLRSEALRTCLEIARQIDISMFRPQKELLEAEFGKNGPLPALKVRLADRTLELGGKIDRIDYYIPIDRSAHKNTDECAVGSTDTGIIDLGSKEQSIRDFSIADKKYVRIIDYKSGSAQYSDKSLYFGEKVQLFIYMNVLKQTGCKPAGLYYFPVHDGFADADTPQYVMSGITVADDEVLRASDTSAAPGAQEIGALGIKVMRSEDGTVAENKDLLHAHTLSALLDYAKLLCGGALQEILTGEIRMSPAGDCAYCEYTGICGMRRADSAVNRPLAAGRDVRRRTADAAQNARETAAWTK